MRIIAFIFSSIFSFQVFSQGMINNGAVITVTNGAYINIVNDTSKGNYQNQNNAWVNNAGTIKVEGNWINNANNIVFTKNDGTVELTGPDQQITGTNSTVFYNLTLLGTGTKTLMVDAGAGGAYKNNINGILDLTSRPFDLNTFTFTQNNPDINSIKRNIGYIISETDAIKGYGTLLRITSSTPNGKSYLYPFGRKDGVYIPLNLTFNTNGSSGGKIDSSGVAISTYPTPPDNLINNRPLPTSINNTQNEYAIENAENTIDRFWISEKVGFSSVPNATINFTYADDEWDKTNSSTNNIFENELGFIRNNGTTWDFSSKGTIDITNNTLITNSQPVFGIYTLANQAECPIAEYVKIGNCATNDILFTDMSTFRKGSVVSHFWNFNNGQKAYDSLTQNVFSAGVYQVQHIVTLSSGCADTVIKDVSINPRPIADFNFDNNHCFNQSIYFTDKSQTSPGNITKWNWDLGNNQTTNTQNGQMKYANAGKYDVKLSVSNNFGCKDSILKKVEIFENPVASFQLNDICIGFETNIKNNSFSNNSTLVSYNWNLENGVFNNEFEPNYSYKTAGTYNVSLSVTDANNCKDDTALMVTVFPKAVANFTYNPNPISYDNPRVSFVNLSQNANSYYWELGDGYSFISEDVEHEYYDTGVFKVMLYANNTEGCSDTIEKNIYVEPIFTIFLPNAFTPGGGDINETFGPEGLMMGWHDYEMLIFNRWGEMVFETHDIANRWDGTYKDKPVQMEAYIYMLRIKDYKSRIHNFKGTVSVIR